MAGLTLTFAQLHKLTRGEIDGALEQDYSDQRRLGSLFITASRLETTVAWSFEAGTISVKRACLPN